jgi:DNA-binding PadR family transcriptional regulator
LTYEDELSKWETEFKKGFAKPLILLILSEKPNYPYQITKLVSKNTKGKITIAGSNIYPILKSMEEEGLILGRKEETKKRVYTITDDGLVFLETLKHLMKEFVEVIQEMIDTHKEL